MSSKAELKKEGKGWNPVTPGWFVLHAAEAPWVRSRRFGRICNFEGGSRFPQIGVNLHVIDPGQPACLYHREDAQEDFFVLSGECRVLIEEEEIPLQGGHFVHCPPGTNHVFVGAGEGPCTILMIGYRPPELSLCYPASPLAAKHGASADSETPDPREAYDEWPVFGEPVEPEWLGQPDRQPG
ncbi:MAG: cupin domain-containing protein [Planctomycetota bacterium]